MIYLTRLNHQSLVVNSDLIKFIENAPDTVLTLTNGEKIVVREKPEEVVQRIISFRRSVSSGLLELGANPAAVPESPRRPDEDPSNDQGRSLRG
jgi:flagellar protein FlbD